MSVALVGQAGDTSSGALGVWLEEKQPVLNDYERAIGGELPKRIVVFAWDMEHSVDCCQATMCLVEPSA